MRLNSGIVHVFRVIFLGMSCQQRHVLSYTSLFVPNNPLIYKQGDIDARKESQYAAHLPRCVRQS